MLEVPRYNKLVSDIFRENSLEYEKEFIDLEASYFTEESIFTDTIYPKFKLNLEKAGDEFVKSIRELRKKFYTDNFKTIKENFEYFFNKVVLYFWSNALVKGGISRDSFSINVMNYIEYIS